ncbi:MAG: tRNA pseudouridine(55) synthase TruB [Gemmatimonadetes bacterium]|nr:MAG: tRNA pseudouridine(55) synthase TruB [Gemmatimonadota bacterium]
MIGPVGAVLPVDKPAGPTSHDVVAWARRALSIRRIGHTGTLDPFATGLLVLCVGPATRLVEHLTGLPKRYRAEVRLGVSTDTHDPEGRVVHEHAGPIQVDADVLGAALEGLRGEILQVPPAFSAKKVDGERMHRRARRGETVRLEPVPVTVYDLTLVSHDGPRLILDVTCSAGTYVRALARDLGEALGVGAHLTALRRTAVGDLRVEDALPGERLREPGGAEAAREHLLEPLRALDHLAHVAVDAEQARRLRLGQAVPVPASDAVLGAAARGGAGTPPGAGTRPGEAREPVAVVEAGRLVAIGRLQDGVLRPRKVFADA